MLWIDHPSGCDHGFVTFVAASPRPDEAPVVVRTELLGVLNQRPTLPEKQLLLDRPTLLLPGCVAQHPAALV